MNTGKQFWALLRFQTAVNPFIWLVPIALGAPLFLTGNYPAWYHPNLSSFLTVHNLFFVGLLGMWALAPEMTRPWRANVDWSSGTEFLLTRAIDRAILYRSRTAFLYILVFSIPIVNISLALTHPDVKVTEYSQITQQKCLRHVPGSALEPDPRGSSAPLISIPRGNVLVEVWHLWLFALTALTVQILFLFLHPFKHRLFISYAIFMILVFLPLAYDLRHLNSGRPTFMERVFFSFAAHQVAFWILTSLALIICQLWCELRYARLEH